MNMYFRGIVCRVGEMAYTDEIKNDDAFISEYIYGPLYKILFPDYAIAICNKNEETNLAQISRAVYDEKGDLRFVIPGDFVIAFQPPGSNGYLDLPDILEKKYMENFKYPDLVRKNKDGTAEIVKYDPKDLDALLDIYSEAVRGKEKNYDMPRIEEVPDIEHGIVNEKIKDYGLGK